MLNIFESDNNIKYIDVKEKQINVNNRYWKADQMFLLGY